MVQPLNVSGRGVVGLSLALLVGVVASTVPARAFDELPAQRIGIQSIDAGGDVLVGARRARFVESRVIGHSVQGRDIVAYRMGTPGGRVALVVGVIHGNEAKGALITAQVRTLEPPPGVDLWVIDSMNPDGQALGTRQNANRVDLNRNFEQNWRAIPATPFSGQFSGRAPADQPETAAIQAFIRDIRPAISIFWHQTSNRVSGGGARPELPIEYARLVGQIVADTPCSSGCTGTETQFTNTVVPEGTSFIVELPGDSSVTEAMVRRHAEAVMTIIAL